MVAVPQAIAATGPKGNITKGDALAVARIAGLLAIALLGVLLSAVFVSGLGAGVDAPDARQQLGAVMAGEGSLSEEAITAFHRAFQTVMVACAACAILGGVVGLLTAPGRVQKTE